MSNCEQFLQVYGNIEGKSLIHLEFRKYRKEALKQTLLSTFNCPNIATNPNRLVFHCDMQLLHLSHDSFCLLSNLGWPCRSTTPSQSVAGRRWWSCWSDLCRGSPAWPCCLVVKHTHLLTWLTVFTFISFLLSVVPSSEPSFHAQLFFPVLADIKKHTSDENPDKIMLEKAIESLKEVMTWVWLSVPA